MRLTACIPGEVCQTILDFNGAHDVASASNANRNSKTCEAPVIREHQHCFYRPDALLPPNSVKALKENVLDYTTLEMNALSQGRRSVVKYGGQTSQVKPSNCFRHPEKNRFTFHSFIVDDVKLAR